MIRLMNGLLTLFITILGIWRFSSGWAVSSSASIKTYWRPVNSFFGSPTEIPRSAITYYTLQAGSPKWLPNFSHPEKGCGVAIVAGQVFDLTGQPVTLIVVEMGELGGDAENTHLSLTGIAPIYGSGGYEFTLPDLRFEQSKFWIQLFGLDGKPVSDRAYFDVFRDCERNLVLVNFVQNLSVNQYLYFLPLSRHSK